MLNSMNSDILKDVCYFYCLKDIWTVFTVWENHCRNTVSYNSFSMVLILLLHPTPHPPNPFPQKIHTHSLIKFQFLDSIPTVKQPVFPLLYNYSFWKFNQIILSWKLVCCFWVVTIQTLTTIRFQWNFRNGRAVTTSKSYCSIKYCWFLLRWHNILTRTYFFTLDIKVSPFTYPYPIIWDFGYVVIYLSLLNFGLFVIFLLGGGWVRIRYYSISCTPSSKLFVSKFHIFTANLELLYIRREINSFPQEMKQYK